MTCSFFFNIPQIAPACAVRHTCKPLRLAIHYDENGLSFLFLISEDKEECFALGGALKARQNWNLLKCRLVCCINDDCNEGSSPPENAVDVFPAKGNNRYKNI